MATVPTKIRDREAADLARLYRDRCKLTHAEFASTHGFTSAAMVWQYLNGHRPLNLVAAARFGFALHAALADFSPRLADEFKHVASLVSYQLPANVVTLTAREPSPAESFPLPSIDETKLRRVGPDDILRLEGGMLAVATQLGIDIRKARRAAK